MSCSEFWYHIEYLDANRNHTEEACNVCRTNDCEFAYEFMPYCNFHECVWVCGDHYMNGEEKCTVDFRWDGEDFWGMQCDEFVDLLENRTNSSDANECDMDCWMVDDCAWNNTSYDYCVESMC